MTAITQLLGQKGHGVVSVGPDHTVFAAIKKMADENIGSLPVIEDGKVVGILTERLYARNVELKGRRADTTLVRQIMVTKVIYARPEQTVEQCLAVMIDRKLRHLPVIDEFRLAGDRLNRRSWAKHRGRSEIHDRSVGALHSRLTRCSRHHKNGPAGAPPEPSSGRAVFNERKS